MKLPINLHYRMQLLCRVSQTLGKGYFTLGKCFAECNTRQRTLGELYIGNSLFAEYFLSGTRQRKVTVTAPSDGDRSFAECLLSRPSAKTTPVGPTASPCAEIRQRGQFKNKLCRVPDLGHSAKASLPSASCRALGKDVFYRLCRVPTDRHSAKPPLSSANWTALGKVYFIFFIFGNQIFCGVFLHYVDL
jgi:hypothetical protein